MIHILKPQRFYCSSSCPILTLLLLLTMSYTLYAQSPRNAQISVDFSKKTEIIDKSKILNVARGGHGINKDLTWMPKFYDNLAAIGVREFRIDWLFSDYYYQVISKNASGQLVYNFSKLDSIITPLLKKNINPVMCMCYMTNALADSMQCQPNDYNLYKSATKAYVKHYKDLGYSGLSWESHNEPEGFTILTPAQTYKMYKYFAAAVKEEDPSAKVGGYGSVGHDWIGYLESFLNEFKSDPSKPPMDFFSFHQYGKSSFEYVPEIEKRFTDRGITIPSLYITEWNNSFGKVEGEGNGGVTGGGFDTPINASYVSMKFINSFTYKNLKKIFYWNFADANPGKQFCGESGLFTVDNHRKAAANTFEMFNKLYSQAIQTSVTDNVTADKKVTSIFTKDDQSKKIAGIISNYNNGSVSIDLTIKNIPLVLSNVDKIRLRTYVIDSTHSNYYYDYQKGYTGSAAGPSEMLAMIADSTFNYNQNVLLKMSLLKYSVTLITIDLISATSIKTIDANEIIKSPNHSINFVERYDLRGRIFNPLSTSHTTSAIVEGNQISSSSGLFIYKTDSRNTLDNNVKEIHIK